jgi:endoglucanase
MGPEEIVDGLLACPTAPFFEALPAQFAVDLADATDGLSAHRDAAGNVVVRTAGEGPPLVLVAHLDHPGFAIDAVVGATAALTFRGGLALTAPTEGAPVDFFRPGDPAPIGRGELEATSGEAGRLTGATALVREGDVDTAGFAMWGFPAVERRDGRIAGRVCDDLVGVAAALAALVAVAGEDLPRPMWGLFTRAEEVGLLGAVEAIRLGTVPRDALVLSLECSKALPEAPQGAGVIVRVGDRASIFDPAVTAAVAAVATEAGAPFQRRLMDGGTCEATAFCAAGYRSSGLALPLGNYHNAADEGLGVAPEHVHEDDLRAELDLLSALARAPLDLDRASTWLDDQTAKAREAFGA